jgi:hypothetical protein
MDVFTNLLNNITKARVTFDNADKSARYKALHPVFSDIGKCMEYIRNNEDYTKYNLFLETLRTISNNRWNY